MFRRSALFGEFPDPAVDIHPWLTLIQEHPRAWAAQVRKVVDQSVQQGVSPAPPVGRQDPSVPCECHVRGRIFGGFGAVRSHAARKHGVRADVMLFAEEDG
eukprot:5183596-Alexandrium_andersonii.AAC.1